ncbi:MAG: DUF427 domain-containing protein [Baekduiaceae bacterium]
MPESVWDYPRPPAVEPCARRARVEFGGSVIADSDAALRVLETSHPPGIYLPPRDVDATRLHEVPGYTTFCEFKGVATYFDLVAEDGRTSSLAAWTYRAPTAAYAALRDHVAFYPGRVDGCWLGDERITPQEGDFYGGWITADVTGPFKGGPGTRGW